jgi:hypothetical protein
MIERGDNGVLRDRTSLGKGSESFALLGPTTSHFLQNEEIALAKPWRFCFVAPAEF